MKIRFQCRLAGDLVPAKRSLEQAVSQLLSSFDVRECPGKSAFLVWQKAIPL